MTARQPVDLHPEHRDPLVRVRLTEHSIGGPAGWLELRPFLALWCAAGAAWLELDGQPFPPHLLAGVDDHRDLLGARLVIVDQALAADALAVLQPAS